VELYFLRHGPAGSRGRWTGPDDERPLTDAGKALIEREAAAFVALGLSPDIIVTSPLVRSYQTAKIVARKLGLLDRFVTDERLAPGFGLRELRGVLQDHPDAIAVMLVGHEPDFSLTVGDLIGGGTVVFRKGGLGRVDAGDATLGDAELAWLLPPSVLTK
jgi:phosphohistidine phosphatase